MNRIIPLMQREWLQHRTGWLVMATLPLVLTLASAGFATMNVHGSVRFDEMANSGPALPTIATMAAVGGTATLMCAIAWFASLVIVSGLARRDHADRSVEFWLSMPVGHAESFVSPMLVHLLLAPAAAWLIGLAGGYAVSALVVARVAGIAAWFALPWWDILLATFAVGLRVLIGLVLATLWLLPLIVGVVLSGAWFRKWSWVVIGVGLGVGSFLLTQVFGQPLLSNAIDGLIQGAKHALVNSPVGIDGRMQDPDDIQLVLQSLPGWALVDTGRALRDLASPLLVGGLLFAGLCFGLLVRWRERAGGTAE